MITLSSYLVNPSSNNPPSVIPYSYFGPVCVVNPRVIIKKPPQIGGVQLNIMIHSFSPNGRTLSIANTITAQISSRVNQVGHIRNLKSSSINLSLFCYPVYAGRLPNLILPQINAHKPDSPNHYAVLVVVFGNRSYDDALIELYDIIKASGYTVIAAAAFIAQHSFTPLIATNRPDQSDLDIMNTFGTLVGDMLIDILDKKAKNISYELCVPGTRPYRPYLRPVNRRGDVFDFRTIVPHFKKNKTTEACRSCGLCVANCPMNNNVKDREFSKCIKCFSCVNSCPAQCIEFDSADLYDHIDELKENYAKVYNRPSYFLAKYSSEVKE